jgi:septal ring factor EnvC (AmiA/AmiB activator)
VTDDLDPRVHQVLQPRSGAHTIFIVVTIAIACLVLAYRHELSAYVLGSSASGAAPAVATEGHPATVEDLETVKRQMTDSARSMIDELNAQKDDIRIQKSDLQRMADQVSTLSNELSSANEKIDALQKAQANASHAELRSEAPQPAAPSRRHFIAARRRPVVPKPDNPNPNSTPASVFPTLVPQGVPPSTGN